MPRFYFDIEKSSRLTHDMEGEDLADREAAKEEALLILTDAANTLLFRGGGAEVTVRVRDDVGQKIYRATLSLTERWTD